MNKKGIRKNCGDDITDDIDSNDFAQNNVE
jgi:hypothetical protein